MRLTKCLAYNVNLNNLPIFSEHLLDFLTGYFFWQVPDKNAFLINCRARVRKAANHGRTIRTWPDARLDRRGRVQDISGIVVVETLFCVFTDDQEE